MAHPNGEAGDVPANEADAAADFEQYLDDFGLDDDAEDEDGADEDLSDNEEIDDLDIDDDDTGKDGDEPGEPAIEAPASLNAEEKATFAQLPKEAQQAWAASETRRNSQVQEATTKASHAQRDAEARAAAADADARATYGQQLEQFVSAFEPQQPDPQLAYQNPQQYIAEKAQYDAMKAQHDHLVQQVKGVQSQANTEAQQAFIAQRDRELMTIPEIANVETRSDYIDRAMGMAKELGFDQAELSEGATARDIKALAQIADWKALAEKYQKAMSSKMQRVRAGKQRSVKPGAAPQDSSRAAKANKSWQRVKSATSKEAKTEAFADYLETTGNL